MGHISTIQPRTSLLLPPFSRWGSFLFTRRVLLRKHLNANTLLFVAGKGIVARLLSRARSKPVKANYRGIPTHACPCGEMVFIVHAVFEDGEVVLYELDCECSACGALLTAPTPID